MKNNYRDSLVDRIMLIPASICPEIFSDFVIRGEGKKQIVWNETMLRDNGMDINRLREICVILENKSDLIGLTPQVKITQ